MADDDRSLRLRGRRVEIAHDAQKRIDIRLVDRRLHGDEDAMSGGFLDGGPSLTGSRGRRTENGFAEQVVLA